MKRTGADRPKRKKMTSVSAVLSAEKKIVDASNFCPHCGILLKNQDNESDGTLQNENIFRTIFFLESEIGFRRGYYIAG